MRPTEKKWYWILAGVALIFLYACGGGGSGDSIAPPPPVADAGPDQSVVMGRPVTLDGSGSDNTVGTTYLWEQLAGQSVVLDNSSSVSPTFTAPDNVAQTGEVLRFQLTVTDSNLATASDNVDITVLWGNLDDFSTDTRSDYTTQEVFLSGPPPPPPNPQFNYDAAGERLEVLNEDDVGLIFSKALPASDNGVFSLDFFPTATFPSGGGLWVRLMQDANNYYEMVAFQWDNVLSPGEPSVFRKVVGGVVVEEVPFVNVNNYVSEDPPTKEHVTITFTPATSTVQAFDETITLNMDPTAINVTRFEIQANQQNAFFDNIELLAVR